MERDNFMLLMLAMTLPPLLMPIVTYEREIALHSYCRYSLLLSSPSCRDLGSEASWEWPSVTQEASRKPQAGLITSKRREMISVREFLEWARKPKTLSHKPETRNDQ
jgi:hypothetical protein